MAQDELEGGKSTVRVWFESNKGALMRVINCFRTNSDWDMHFKRISTLPT